MDKEKASAKTKAREVFKPLHITDKAWWISAAHINIPLAHNLETILFMFQLTWFKFQDR